MNNRETREYEMFLRVLLFLNKYHNELKNIPAIIAAQNILQTQTNKLAELGTGKVSATVDADDATIYKGDARDALRDAMQNITDMWQPMAKNYHDSFHKFRMPHGSDQLLIDTAGQYIADATPLEAAFIARAMPADFVADLLAKRDTFAAINSESEAARLERIGVNAQFGDPIKKCRAAVSDIDPIINMTFRADPGKRAEWLSAAHVEKAAKKSKS